MNNHEFIVDFCKRRGAGEVVEPGLRSGLDSTGGNNFYLGGDHSGKVPAALTESGRVPRMEEKSIPFPGECFDLVSNNQVMEHVIEVDWSDQRVEHRPALLKLPAFAKRFVARKYGGMILVSMK